MSEQIEGSISSIPLGELDDVEEQKTVMIAVTEIVRADPKRVFMLIQNRSDTDIFVSTKPNVSTSTGIKLVALTGDLAYSRRDHGSLVTRAFFAVSSADTKVLTIQQAFNLRKGGSK